MKVRIGSTWDGQPIPAAQQVHLSLELDEQALTITLVAPFYNDPPPPLPAGPCPELWEYEVVELFIANGQHYTEIELAPRGQHLVLQLHGIRQKVAEQLPITYAAHIDGPQWQGQARIPVSLLPAQPWTMNAYAIHGQGTERTYLAAHAVPGSEPDFHRLHCFVPWTGNGASTPVKTQSSSQ
jgi:hypothetical protein